MSSYLNLNSACELNSIHVNTLITVIYYICMIHEPINQE